jgi:4-azaleucine resistance transporter AzlC
MRQAQIAGGSASREFMDGVRDTMPLLVAASPFGIVFGAAAIAAGYSMFENILTSALLFAGASQFVFIEVNAQNVPAWTVVFAVFAINFRHILYSASTGRRIAAFGPVQKALAFFLLTDIQFAGVEARAAANPQGRVSVGYYFGMGLPLYVMWVVTSIIGRLFGKLIAHPEQWGLDFVLPIYFLAVLMGFRKRDRFVLIAAASGVVSLASFKLLGPPWHISLGAFAGIAAAAIAAPRVKSRV